MLAHYSHVRIEAKRRALDVLATERECESTSSVQAASRNSEYESELGYDTMNVTNESTNDTGLESVAPKVIENNGRPEWTRTIDLFRVKEAL
jgi:hypothetical protein